MAEKESEAKQPTGKEIAQAKAAELKRREARKEEIKFLKEETAYMELLLKYYSYQAQIPRVQAELMRMNMEANAENGPVMTQVKEEVPEVPDTKPEE